MSTIETIDKLMMAEALQECLSRFPKIDTLKAEHSEALEALISGRDVVAILPTGFGKSLIFQLFCEIKLATNLVSRAFCSPSQFFFWYVTQRFPQRTEPHSFPFVFVVSLRSVEQTNHMIAKCE